MTPWQRFVCAARGEALPQPPVALIVDSPWLPGYAGLNTVDYFARNDEWLRSTLALRGRFPDVAWIPGFWVEYGMAAEPSAYGARVLWHPKQPPSLEPVPGGLGALLELPVPDPREHGLMPLVLSRYSDAVARLAAEGGVRREEDAGADPQREGGSVVGDFGERRRVAHELRRPREEVVAQHRV